MLLDLRRWVWTLCLVASIALATAAADSRVSCARHPLASHRPEQHIERRSGLFRRLRPRPRPQYNAQGLASAVHPGLGALLRWDNRRLRAKTLRAEERRAQAHAQLQPSRPRRQPTEIERPAGSSTIDSSQASPEWFTPPQSPTEQPSGPAPTDKKQRKKKWWQSGRKMLPKCFSCSPVVE